MATATRRMKADLPADERDLWLTGQLGPWLGFHGGVRVEVIGGDVFVSRAAGQTATQAFSTVLAALVNTRGPHCARDVRMLVEGDADFAVIDVQRWAESMARRGTPQGGGLVAVEGTEPDAGARRGPGPPPPRGS